MFNLILSFCIILFFSIPDELYSQRNHGSVLNKLLIANKCDYSQLQNSEILLRSVRAKKGHIKSVKIKRYMKFYMKILASSEIIESPPKDS